jgi:ABC-type ATPase involved in cell division
MISFERVSKRYDNSHDALREVSFRHRRRRSWSF